MRHPGLRCYVELWPWPGADRCVRLDAENGCDVIVMDMMAMYNVADGV